MAENRVGDMLGQSSSNNNADQGQPSGNNNARGGPDIELLKSIDRTLKDILSTGGGMSQSAARSYMPGDRRDAERWQPNRSRNNTDTRNKSDFKNTRKSFGGGSVFDEFTDALEDVLLESIVGPDFKNNIASVISGFGDAIGVEVQDIPKTLGRELGQSILKTDMGQKLTSSLSGYANKAMSGLKNSFMKGVSNYTDGKAGGAEIKARFGAMFDPKHFSQSGVKSAPGPNKVTPSATSVDIQQSSQSSMFDDSVSRFSQAVDRFADGSDVTKGSSLDKSIEDIKPEDIKDKSANSPELKRKAEQMKSAEPDIGEKVSDLAQNADDVSKLDNVVDLAQLKDNFLGSAKDSFLNMFGKGGASAAAETATTAATSSAVAGAETAAMGTAAAGTAATTTAATAAAGSTAAAGTAAAGTAAAGAAATGASAALAGLASTLGAVLPPLLAIVAAFIILDKLLDQFTPAIEGAKKMFEAAGKAAKRYEESRKQNLEFQKKRMNDDLNTIVEAPFNILKEAAQNLYDAWDSNIRTINQTQGYTKDSLYDLIGDYSERLRQEGLTSVVSSSDITSNLTKVLESGLSGDIAEEFAYLATKLNAEIPTQDFFDYAESYASIAANALTQGLSRSEAISYANEQLESFASNVLYASRELSGGFSTGLNNASDLFTKAVQISQAAKTNNSTEIGGVLSAVAATVGSIAPDLGGELVDAVVDAATGGNSESIVALRSLAGINASNTEFLRSLATNPQSVFEDVFRGLGRYQNMSPDANMEVAEGLSQVFGVSMDALARVDFNYLAQAISEMNVNNKSLDENMKLLASGESTTTSEQLKMQQINKYMLDEGLTYVMDNEAARSIQEHMWDEQLAREMQEATYAVELKGGALDFLEGIKQTVDNIINFLNPIGYLFKSITNLVATAKEAEAQDDRVRELLELGKVGNGNAKDLYNLTTLNQDLNLTPSIVEMMGGYDAYEAISTGLSVFNNSHNFSGWWDGRSAYKSAVSSALQTALTSSLSSGRNSVYSWANVSKSAATSFQNSKMGSELSSPVSSAAATNQNIQDAGKQRLQSFLDTMSDYIKDAANGDGDASYEGWKATAQSKGINDLSAALEEYGISENDLQSSFVSSQADAANQAKHERELKEEAFWEQGNLYFANQQDGWITWETLVSENQQTMITNQSTMIANQSTMITNQGIMIENQNSLLTYLQEEQIVQLKDINDATSDSYDKLKTFYSDWVNYYVDHTFYSENSNNAYTKVKNDEKDAANDSVLSLAKALTEQTESFKDPTVQTNALLAKILIVVEAIMQQSNESGQVSIPDALSLLATGATTKLI